MPIYEYQCKCGNRFEKIIAFDDVEKCKEYFSCDKCKGVGKRLLSTGISGMNGNAEPWEYEYTHKAKPKFVRDSKGNKIKFNPNTQMKGRKGSGS